MEEADVGLSFDFEGGLDAAAVAGAPPSTSQPSSTTAAAAALGTVPAVASQKTSERSTRYFRQTVCRHWLRGLCMKGDVCGYLHQLDRARMPICRFFAKYGVCAEPDCVYKHTDEEIKECNMYKLGFCPNGPDCRYRHQKMPGPFPPLEDSLQKIQQRVTAANGGYPGRHSSHRPVRHHLQEEGQPWQQASSGRVQTVESLNVDQPRPQRPQLQQQQQQQQQQQTVEQPSSNGPTNPPSFVSASTPLPQGSCRYFIVKSSNRENLGLSVERGMWATHRNNEAKLNGAFDSCDNVILIFSVNETRHFQGCARMMSKIGVVVGGGGWKFAHGTAHFGRNFRLNWLKLCELSFHKTRHLRNPYNENLPVKISRDCQELERTVGEQLASLLYLEPDSDLMGVAIEAEAKREDEKAHGASSAQEAEETKIVPFEDNDDDQEDESDEDESSSQTANASHSRGRSSFGRGAMWGTQGLRGRGGRGTLGGRNMEFQMDMSGGDGFGRGFDRFRMGSGDRYGVSGDMFTAGAGPSRGFSPYGPPGPRFGGPEFSNLGPGTAMGFGPMDVTITAAGMLFPGRPPVPNGMFPHSGPGIMGPPGGSMMGGVRPVNMMGTARPHYMGGAGATGRGSRFSGIPSRPPQASGSGRGRRGSTDQQRRRRNERNFGNEGLTGGEPKSMSKTRQRFPSSAETSDIDGEVESNVPARPQQQHGSSYGNNAIDNEDDSESEDEAPRRSRHGEGRKKKRGWEGQLPSSGTAWSQHGDKGQKWVGGEADDLTY